MIIDQESKKRVVYPCYLAYLVSGSIILSFGVILPYLIRERGISYTIAGGLLSSLAIGNLLASVVYPFLCAKLDQKKVTLFLSGIYPVCLCLFTFHMPVAVLYAMILLIGITKGMITIINNHAVKEVTGNSNKYLNLLHMWYAVGALASPLLISALTTCEISWKIIMRVMAALSVLLCVAYAYTDFDRFADRKTEEQDKASQPASMAVDKQKGLWFLKLFGFYVAVGAIFCYMGMENTVNGWFVTYLESIGLMSESLAAVMVSVTWTMIMIGRIIVAAVSSKCSSAKILIAISILQLTAVLMLVSAKTTVFVVLALVLLGLGMAGTFPTVMSFTGDVMKGSTLGVSILTGIGSFGGILTPQIIGMIADSSGFSQAIGMMVIAAVLLVIFSFLTIPATKKIES